MKEDTILKVLPWDVRSIIQKEKLEFEYLYCMQPGVVSYINRITAGMWKDHDVKRFDPSDIGRKFLDSGACGRSGG